MFSITEGGNKSYPIAIIQSGPYKNDKIYLERPERIDKTKQWVDLKKYKLIPYLYSGPEGQRVITYISGPSGSGKSTLAGEYAMTFVKDQTEHIKKRKAEARAEAKALGLDPKAIKETPDTPDVFILSLKDSKQDPAYAKLNPIQIKLDQSIVGDKNRIKLSEFPDNCLVIFDDIGTIADREVEREVELLANSLMQIARYRNIHMIITTHVTNENKPFYKVLMTELHNYVFFPSSGATKPIKYCLNTYFDLNTKEIKKVIDLGSDRDYSWTLVKRTNPQLIMNPHGVEILKHFLENKEHDIQDESTNDD